jgi:hypothetical protein
LAYFAPRQRQAVATLLRHVAETRPELIDSWMYPDELRSAIGIWSSPAEGETVTPEL